MKTRINNVHLIDGLVGKSERCKRLIVISGLLGDFDTIEYIQAIMKVKDLMDIRHINVYLLAIGNQASIARFCAFTGFPRENIQVYPDNKVHQSLGLYNGLSTPFGHYIDFILMCLGIGSPGTLKEVIRGYLGDKKAIQIFKENEQINIGRFKLIQGALFRYAGGEGFQRPFELATLRLSNMIEVISNWEIYMPYQTYLTQRGGTIFLDEDNSILYTHKIDGILSFSKDMSKPLEFLDTWLNK